MPYRRCCYERRFRVPPHARRLSRDASEKASPRAAECCVSPAAVQNAVSNHSRIDSERIKGVRPDESKGSGLNGIVHGIFPLATLIFFPSAQR